MKDKKLVRILLKEDEHPIYVNPDQWDLVEGDKGLWIINKYSRHGVHMAMLIEYDRIEKTEDCSGDELQAAAEK